MALGGRIGLSVVGPKLWNALLANVYFTESSFPEFISIVDCFRVFSCIPTDSPWNLACTLFA